MYKTKREQERDMLTRLGILFTAFFVLLLLGATVYHIFEGWSFLESLYFATISITSRGLTDRVPHHWFSIIFSVIYLIVGVSILIASLSTLIAHYTAHYQTHLESKVNKLFDKKKKRPDKWVVLKKRK